MCNTSLFLIIDYARYILSKHHFTITFTYKTYFDAQNNYEKKNNESSFCQLMSRKKQEVLGLFLLIHQLIKNYLCTSALFIDETELGL